MQWWSRQGRVRGTRQGLGSTVRRLWMGGTAGDCCADERARQLRVNTDVSDKVTAVTSSAQGLSREKSASGALTGAGTEDQGAVLAQQGQGADQGGVFGGVQRGVHPWAVTERRRQGRRRGQWRQAMRSPALREHRERGREGGRGGLQEPVGRDARGWWRREQ